MAGPWEKYQTAEPPAADGPWGRYTAPDPVQMSVDKSVSDTGRMSTMEDVLRSAATGAGEGVAQSVGLIGDVTSGADMLGEWVGDQLGLEPLSPDQKETMKRPMGLPDITPPTTAEVEAATGLDQVKHEPQTTAGEYARTVAQFATPTAVGGVRSALKYGAVPGLASETAGQATEGTPLETPARIIGALTGGGVMAFLSRPTQASAALKNAMPEGVTNNDIMKADSLMAQGKRVGVDLTWPEALHKVTNGRVDITNLQRILEQNRGSRPILTDMLGQRPAQTAAGMDEAMNALTIGAHRTDPVRAGLAIQKASGDAIDGVRKRINAATKPYYDAAATDMLDDATFSALKRDPLYEDALQAVRNDPVHSRFIQGLPDRSVGVQNEIKKHLDRVASTAATKGDNAGAAVYGEAAGDVRGAAVDASPNYKTAVEEQAKQRADQLAPIEASPLGPMSKTSDILKQGRAVLSSAPAEGSEAVVRDTISLLSKRAPHESFMLVRSHLKNQFDEATQSLIAGPNEWGGAKFAATIRGNPQQAKNLEAAVRALPDGDIRWEGLNEFLEVLEATGRRQRPGSMTAFNQEALKDLGKGGLTVEAARSIRSVGNRLFDFYEGWRVGKNSEALARIITDPRSGPMLKKLASQRTDAGKRAVAGYLVTFYGQSGLQATDRVKREGQ